MERSCSCQVCMRMRGDEGRAVVGYACQMGRWRGPDLDRNNPNSLGFRRYILLLKAFGNQHKMYALRGGVVNGSQNCINFICVKSLSGLALAVLNPLITPFSGTNFRVGLTQIWVDVDYGQIKSLYQIAVCAETKQSSGNRA